MSLGTLETLSLEELEQAETHPFEEAILTDPWMDWVQANQEEYFNGFYAESPPSSPVYSSFMSEASFPSLSTSPESKKSKRPLNDQ